MLVLTRRHLRSLLLNIESGRTMKNAYSYRRTLLLALFAFTSCLFNDADDIKEFFQNVENRVGQDTIRLFRSCQMDSSGQCLDLINKQFEQEYYKLDRNSIIHKDLDSIEQVPDSIKVLILEIKFYYYVRGEVADLYDIRNQLKKLRIYKD
jgi:hypothetical protein